MRRYSLLLGVFACFSISSALVRADIIGWTDWISGTSGPNGSAVGVINSSFNGQPIEVNVSYSGEIAFIQTGPGGTNYFIPSAPYVSATVSNPPPGPDIIALSLATAKTLSFDQPVSNLLFAVVSLNGNGYRFDQDFEILSFGHGFWGNGTLSKVDNGNGTWDLIGTGEPHGTIEFTGTFTSVTWTSLTNEFWNGFNVGIRGVVPEPSSLALLAITGLITTRSRWRRNSPRIA